MAGNAPARSIDVLRLTRDECEQISSGSGKVAQVDGQGAGQGSQSTSTEALTSINDEIDALHSQLQGGEPSAHSMALRDRLGSSIRRRLYRFLWWQSEQIKALAALTLKSGREEKKVLDALLQNIGTLRRENRETHQLLLEYKRQVHEGDKRLQQLESAQLKLKAAEIERSIHQKVQLDAEMNSLRQDLSDTKGALNLAETRMADQIARENKASMEEMAGLAQKIEAETAQLARRLEAETAQKEQLAARLSELGLLTHQTQKTLSIQDRRLGLFIEEARKCLPGPIAREQVQSMVNEHSEHRYDLLYAAFEDIFRGTREEIKARQTVYLPLLQDQGIGSAAMPLLDLGCGRGEWLELLGEHGLQARGVDRNEDMVDRCRSLGLQVVQNEALPYLATLPDACLGAVTSFHMVEHMPLDMVLTLVDQSLRVLRPGGMLILETPNPDNILVGASTFYLDPTHLKPLPSPMLRFFVEARGFCEARVLELHPYPETVRFPDDSNGIASRLNEYFYGPQDYAIIGRRP